MIANCGHTLCSQCLTVLLQSEEGGKCPLDKSLFPPEYTTVQAFPINFTVQHLIEESSKWDMCKDHNEEARLICLIDKCKVCHDCVYGGKHEGHNIKPLKKVRQELEQEIKNLESTLGSFDRHGKDIVQLLEERKSEVLETVKARFQDIRFHLQRKELELWSEITSFFDMEKNIVNHIFGQKSILRNEILKKISDRRDIKVS
jgi:hypothetical protein